MNQIDKHYYWRHHSTEGVGRYRIACTCRKPNAGMLLRAASGLSFDLYRSYMTGDKASDLEAAARAGRRTIQVEAGCRRELVDSVGRAPLRVVRVARDLAAAVAFLLARCGLGQDLTR